MIICNNVVVKNKYRTETYKFRSYNKDVIDCSNEINAGYLYDDIILIGVREFIDDFFIPFEYDYKQKHGTYYIDITDKGNTSIRFEEDDSLNTISDLHLFTIRKIINFVEDKESNITGKYNSFRNKYNALKYIEDGKFHIHLLNDNTYLDNSELLFFKIYYDADIKFKDKYLKFVECMSDANNNSQYLDIVYTVKDDILLDFTFELYNKD